MHAPELDSTAQYFVKLLGFFITKTNNSGDVYLKHLGEVRSLPPPTLVIQVNTNELRRVVYGEPLDYADGCVFISGDCGLTFRQGPEEVQLGDRVLLNARRFRTRENLPYPASI